MVKNDYIYTQPPVSLKLSLHGTDLLIGKALGYLAGYQWFSNIYFRRYPLLEVALKANGVKMNDTLLSYRKIGSFIAIDSQGKELWISVKGYPEKSSNVQARHWFSGAVFDLVLYHGENSNVRLGIALPEGFVTYNNLLPRIKWFKESLSFTVYWVAEDGNVREE